MIGVVIVAHGGLASEYLAAVEHVLGRQDGMRAIAIQPEDDRETKRAEICAAADAVDRGEGVVIATDMFGGSPSNLSVSACDCASRRILYGVNLPMLVKLTRSRSKALDIAIAAACAAGHKYMDCYTPTAPDGTTRAAE